MLANQKAWGSILNQRMSFLICPVLILHDFLHINYKEKHQLKPREVHEKCSYQNLKSKTDL